MCVAEIEDRVESTKRDVHDTFEQTSCHALASSSPIHPYVLFIFPSQLQMVQIFHASLTTSPHLESSITYPVSMVF